MTAHQSKGKEFDAVIIPDATDQSYPDSVKGRNLFYVALTRGSAMWTLIATDTTPPPPHPQGVGKVGSCGEDEVDGPAWVSCVVS